MQSQVKPSAGLRGRLNCSGHSSKGKINMAISQLSNYYIYCMYIICLIMSTNIHVIVHAEMADSKYITIYGHA